MGIEFNKKYPDCEVEFAQAVGNEFCKSSVYQTEECGWDGGDCVELNEKYPDCNVENPLWIGDGYCHGRLNYNTEECGFDGGDCIEFNKKYPNCTQYVWNQQIGNG